MFERLQKIVTLWNNQAEIMALSQRDLDELEVTREQLLHLSRLPDSLPARVDAMAAIFGVTREALQYPRADYVEILETCEHCGAVKKCAQALADPATKPADCAFCPNARAFAAR